MNLKLLKEASYLIKSSYHKYNYRSGRPIWEKNPDWESDAITSRDWYDKVGKQNYYAPDKDESDKNRMSQEDFYAFLNRHGIDQFVEGGEWGSTKRKQQKALVDLIRDSQPEGMGPEAYKYWIDAPNNLILKDYILNPEHSPRPLVISENAPLDKLRELILSGVDEANEAAGYKTEDIKKAVEKLEKEFGR